MYKTKSVPATLVRLAKKQGGVLTHAQAVAGMGRAPLRRLVDQGLWRRVTTSIYATSPSDPTPQHLLWAGHLLGGPGSALGGRAALHLGGLGDAPDVVQVWVPRHQGRVNRPGFTFSEDGWGRLDHTLGTLPRIRAEEALIDVGQGEDVEGWVTLLAEAARKDLVFLPEIVRRIDARPRVTQRAMLRGVALDLDGVESTLQWIYRDEVERAHALPAGSRQVKVVSGWRCDVAYDGFSLIVELDGTIHLKRVFRDLERDNEHAITESTTLRYGSIALRAQACHVAWQVGWALGVRGWLGTPARCATCPPAHEIERLRRRLFE